MSTDTKYFRWPLIFLLVCLALQALSYIFFANQIIQFPYDVNSGEGLILSRALSISRGEAVYTPIGVEPYIVMNYTPVFEWVLSGLISMFGPDLGWGRLLSVVSTVLIGFFAGLIVHTVTRSRLIAVIAGLLFICSGWVRVWSVLCRTDMFALMCTCAGLWAFVRGLHQSRARGWMIVSVIFFMLGLFTRQSLIAASLSCMIHLFFEGVRGADKSRLMHGVRRMFPLGAAMVVLGLGICLLLQALTGGEFYRHTFTYTLDEFALDRFTGFLSVFLKFHGILTVLALSATVINLWRRENIWASAYWIFAGLVTITAGKTGSSINYFLEFYLAGCLIVGIWLGQIVKSSRRQWTVLVGPSLAIVLIFAQVLVFYRTAETATPPQDYRAASEEIADYVQNASGEVLLEYPGYAVQQGRTIVFQPFTMTRLAERGMWDQQPFIRDIAARRFDLIVVSNIGLQFNRWTPEMVKAIEKNYQEVRQLSCFELSYYHYSVNFFHVYQPRETFE